MGEYSYSIVQVYVCPFFFSRIVLFIKIVLSPYLLVAFLMGPSASTALKGFGKINFCVFF